MLIIGITGTLGAGKGTIVDYLVKEKGFCHFSVREFLKEKLVEAGLAVNRDSLTSIANTLRSENSPSYVTDQLYLKAMKTGINCVIESIRTPGEIDSLKKTGDFILFAVDADPLIRYERIVKRASETDSISFETFTANEAREMQSDNPNHQNLSACIQKADYLFTNNNGIEQLYVSVESTLNKLICSN